MRYRAFIVAFLALCLGILNLPDKALAANSNSLTYKQIMGTGLANTCPKLGETTRGSIPIDSDKFYTLTDLCLQPITFLVKEESVNRRKEAEFVPTKLMTRATSTLDAIQGQLKPDSDGSLTFFEEDGIDFQAVTVQLPGGERVPFLFTVKNLVAKSQPGLTSINTSTDFEGKFNVSPYRTSNFLDPKGRGLSTGYDTAVALPVRPEEELARANVKSFEVGEGRISLQVAKVNSGTGEIAGTFESEQPSDTEFGVHEAKDVRVKGIFYARVEPA